MSCTYLTHFAACLSHATLEASGLSICTFACINEDKPWTIIDLMLRDEGHGWSLCEWPVVHILVHVPEEAV